MIHTFNTAFLQEVYSGVYSGCLNFTIEGFQKEWWQVHQPNGLVKNTVMEVSIIPLLWFMP